MSRDLVLERSGVGEVRIVGELGFANAGEGIARADEMFDGSASVSVDLGGLERADSATLGVLLDWAARAARRGIRLTFEHVPDGVRALAHLCDAEPLLGIAD